MANAAASNNPLRARQTPKNPKPNAWNIMPHKKKFRKCIQVHSESDQFIYKKIKSICIKKPSATQNTYTHKQKQANKNKQTNKQTKAKTNEQPSEQKNNKQQKREKSKTTKTKRTEPKLKTE